MPWRERKCQGRHKDTKGNGASWNNHFGGGIAIAKTFDPVPAEVERVAKLIVDAAFQVHKELGPGLLKVETMVPLFDAQLLTYLKLTQKGLGLLINFNVPLIKGGIKRLVL